MEPVSGGLVLLRSGDAAPCGVYWPSLPAARILTAMFGVG